MWYAKTLLKLCDKVKLYKAIDSGTERGANPTKSRGAGLVNPWANFISLAWSQLAGNWRFKSTPTILAFQPEGKGMDGKLSAILLEFW